MAVIDFLRETLEAQGTRLHLWLEDGDGEGFGSGRIELLCGIDRHGSLNQAAKELGMSYRGAWGKLRKAEQIVGVPLVQAHGAKREGCRLTPEGRQLLDFFEVWRRDVALFAARRASQLLDDFRTQPGRHNGTGQTAPDCPGENAPKVG